MREMRIPLALAAALALAGCFSFGPKTPPSLLTLTAAEALPAGTSRTAEASAAITVLAPTVPQELRANRVPVRSGGTAVAYLKDAAWVEPPAALFGRLVAETISARTGRVVLDPRQFSFDPGTRLTGQLQSFGVDSDRSEVVLIYDAALARGATGVETRRFEARVALPTIDATAAAPALNQAANQVAMQVADWIGR